MKYLEGKFVQMTQEELEDLVRNNVEGKEEFSTEDLHEFTYGDIFVRDLKLSFNKPEKLSNFQEWVNRNDDYDMINVSDLIVGLQHMKKLSCQIDYLLIGM